MKPGENALGSDSLFYHSEMFVCVSVMSRHRQIVPHHGQLAFTIVDVATSCHIYLSHPNVLLMLQILAN